VGAVTARAERRARESECELEKVAKARDGQGEDASLEQYSNVIIYALRWYKHHSRHSKPCNSASFAILLYNYIHIMHTSMSTQLNTSMSTQDINVSTEQHSIEQHSTDAHMMDT
jgi:hypothetical protein